MMKRVILGAAFLLGSAAAFAGGWDRAPVIAIGDGQPVAGAWSWLRRDHNSINVHVKTSALQAGNAYTVWVMAFNWPKYCAIPHECGLGDLPVGPDHDPRVQGSIVAVTGGVVGDDGSAEFVGTVYEPLLGNNGTEVLFGPGMTDARRAEIQVVVRSHGPAAADLVSLFESISSYSGNCYVDEGFQCADEQIAIHRVKRKGRRR